MKRLFLAMSAMVAFGWAAQPALAQGNITRPTVSPWLNTFRQGGSAGYNYYTLVRPEFAFRNSIRDLQVANTANQQWQAGGTEELPATGHPSGFQTQYRYFGSLGNLSSTATGGGFSGPLRGGALGGPGTPNVGLQVTPQTGGRR
jgi:hypothetical protein